MLCVSMTSALIRIECSLAFHDQMDGETMGSEVDSQHARDMRCRQIQGSCSWPMGARYTESTLSPEKTRSFHSEPESTNRTEEHTSELQSLMRHSYAVFCLKKK